MRIYVLLSGGTSHYVIDQSMINICDMKNMFGEEAKHNPLDSTSKQISYLISYRL
jgi:ribosome-binding protein aMBF1 (putative translation factor)